MATRIQLRRDTAADWVANNPTLELGEPGYETDTNKLKIGNGIDDWNNLEYAIIEQFDSQWSSLLGTPTTLSGYGITDALPLAGGTMTGAIDAPTVDNHKLKFLYADQSEFPSATTYHGAIAHSHADGKIYFAHSGAWQPVKNETVFENITLIDTPGSLYQYNFNNILTTVFYHINLSSNWTVNLINLPVGNNREFAFKFYIEQGPTAYVPVTLQIDSLSQTINWKSGSTPSGTSNATDIITFNIIRYDDDWFVQAELQKPAEGFTTLAQYGILDAYTKTEIDNLTLNDLSNVNVGSPTNNQILAFSGGNWVPVSTFVGNVSTTSITSPLSAPLTIAPATTFSSNLTVTGNLTVNGSTTTINSTTLTVDDLNIVLASGAADATAANGAGITIDGASATILYNSATDSFVINKEITAGLNASSLEATAANIDIGTGGNTRKFRDLFLSDGVKAGLSTISGRDFGRYPRMNTSGSSYTLLGDLWNQILINNIPIADAPNFSTLLTTTNPDTGFDYGDVNQDGTVGRLDDLSDLTKAHSELGIGNAPSPISPASTAAKNAYNAINAKILEEPNLYFDEFIARTVSGITYNIPILDSGPGVGNSSDSPDIWLGNGVNKVNTVPGTFFKELPLQSSVENVDTKSISLAGSTVDFDYSSSSIFYVNNSLGYNFTANITNFTAKRDIVTSILLIIVQGATAGIPTALEIDGVSSTINWQEGSLPPGNINAYDFVSFNIYVQANGTKVVFGSLATYS